MGRQVPTRRRIWDILVAIKLGMIPRQLLTLRWNLVNRCLLCPLGGMKSSDSMVSYTCIVYMYVTIWASPLNVSGVCYRWDKVQSIWLATTNSLLSLATWRLWCLLGGIKSLQERPRDSGDSYCICTCSSLSLAARCLWCTLWDKVWSGWFRG
jgi:hypothetical protein